jgi:hypothetical protein
MPKGKQPEKPWQKYTKDLILTNLIRAGNGHVAMELHDLRPVA